MIVSESGYIRTFPPFTFYFLPLPRVPLLRQSRRFLGPARHPGRAADPLSPAAVAGADDQHAVSARPDAARKRVGQALRTDPDVDPVVAAIADGSADHLAPGPAALDPAGFRPANRGGARQFGLDECLQGKPGQTTQQA